MARSCGRRRDYEGLARLSAIDCEKQQRFHVDLTFHVFFSLIVSFHSVLLVVCLVGKHYRSIDIDCRRPLDGLHRRILGKF